MQYECKECKAKFEKNLGQAACPKCGSRNLWVTGGETEAVFRVLALVAAVLLVFYFLSPTLFLGALIGAAIATPLVIWSVYRLRKPGKQK